MEPTVGVIVPPPDPQELLRNLAFSLASDLGPELSAVERLAILQTHDLTRFVNQHWWVDLLVRAGCYEEAERNYDSLEHWRKLGDLAWARGDFRRAESCYLQPRDLKGTTPRTGPDWDRLLRLSCVQEEWGKVIEYFLASDCMPLPEYRMIVLNGSSCSPGPYARMLAEAMRSSGRAGDVALSNSVAKRLGVGKEEWRALLAATALPDPRRMVALLRAATPRMTKANALTLHEAVERGLTDEAATVGQAVTNCTSILERARRARGAFFSGGRDSDLQDFLDAVLSLKVTELCRTMLFEALDRESGELEKFLAEYRVRLFGAHPIMNKRLFGRLLSARFETGAGLQPGDVITGLFQTLWIPAQSQKERTLDQRFDLDKLAASREWAEARLEDWLRAEGAPMAEAFRAAWTKSTTSSSEARSLPEWQTLVRGAQAYLGDRWAEELAHEQWVSEAKMFQLLKKEFKGCALERHAQPLWLAPQHFDCYLPELKLAVEYMGEQHYRPIEVFGGEAGFLKTRDRDERKRELCIRTGITLEYVRFDEDLGKRIEEITAALSR